MRLTHLDREDWNRFAPYVDSLLIPVYRVRIAGKQPDLTEPKFTEKTAKLVEQELTGRLLLMPAIPYDGRGGAVFLRYAAGVVSELRGSGFHHLFLAGVGTLFPAGDIRSLEAGGCRWISLTGPDDTGPEEAADSAVRRIVRIWESGQGE